MAQTLKFGNGTWATKKGSTLAYNDEDGNFKPLPFTYTGAGKGTRVNKEGLIEVVENDKPRIDYTDSEDGVFLLEKAATNLIPYSNFDDGWELSNTTRTLNNSTSPDGNLNAVSLKSSTSSSNEKYIRRYVGVSASTDYTFSVFAKKNELSEIRLSSTGNSNAFAFFNLSNGTIGSVGSSATAKIDNFGNGWYKCSIKHQNSITGIFSVINLSIDGSVNISTNVNDGVYLFGSQYETENLSSYIPTEGSAQTRLAETANGSGSSGVFNDSEGVLFADIKNFGVGTNYISLNTGNNTQKILIGLLSENTIRVFVQGTGGDFFQDITSNNIQFNKISLKYKINDFSLWINGFEAYSNTSLITFSGLSSLDFHNPYLGGTDIFYGKTKEIAYYDEVLTDLELETLTSYRTWEEMVKELNLNIIHNE